MDVEPSYRAPLLPAAAGETSLGPPNRLGALRALAEPVRLALVDDLAHDNACACELRERLGLSAPLISHHLKVLREAGLVHTRKAGRRLEVELDREALGRVAASLLAHERAV